MGAAASSSISWAASLFGGGRGEGQKKHATPLHAWQARRGGKEEVCLAVRGRGGKTRGVRARVRADVGAWGKGRGGRGRAAQRLPAKQGHKAAARHRPCTPLQRWGVRSVLDSVPVGMQARENNDNKKAAWWASGRERERGK